MPKTKEKVRPVLRVSPMPNIEVRNTCRRPSNCK